MENFISDNYLILIVVLAFLLFSLIGYLIDTSKNKKRNKPVKEENVFYTEENLQEEVIPQNEVLPHDEVTLQEENVSQDEVISQEMPINEEVTEQPINSYNDEEFIISDDILDKVPVVDAPNIDKK